MRSKRRGFTLIELLIVVAIIAILAAIAVPNFLEAQVRSKVSRTKADLRSLTTAMELYRVDQDRYPLMCLIDQSTGFMVNPWVRTPSGTYYWEQFFAVGALTTPVAYISSEPWDPFYLRPRHSNLLSLRYCYSAHYDSYLGAEATLTAMRRAFGAWRVWGSGPDYDRRDVYLRDPRASVIVYDPTNGTVSDGDILRSELSPEGQRVFVPGVVE